MGIAEKIPQHYKYLLGFACMLVRNRDTAKDLVQETVVRALTYEHTFAGDDRALKTWLCTILKNEHIRQYRYDAVRRNAALGLQAIYASVSSNHAEAELTFESVCRRAAFVPGVQLLALLHVAVDEMSYEEVAKLQGVPVGTIRSRVHRARLALDEDH